MEAGKLKKLYHALRKAEATLVVTLEGDTVHVFHMEDMDANDYLLDKAIEYIDGMQGDE